MKIATFNVRTDTPVDGENRWQFRKGLILDKLTAEQPDVIGFQETTPVMANFIKKYMPAYWFVGCGRNADYLGENNMIGFKPDKYELIELETFWLSETPDVPGSRYANQSVCPRVCTHAVLRPLDGGTMFHAYNTHLDHISDEARRLGARAILDHMARDLKRCPLPLTLTGDMNAYPDSAPIQEFLNDKTVHLTNQTPDFPASYHAYGADMAQPQIDYIFTQGFEAVGAPEAWGITEFGKYMSDHNALCAYVEPCAR